MKLYVDKVVVVKEDYVDERYLVWEQGKLDQPIALLMRLEAEKLRDDLIAALNLPLPKIDTKQKKR